MKNEDLLYAYSYLYKKNNYTKIAGAILGLFYTSNKKYFTMEEVIVELDSDKQSIEDGIALLIKNGEVKKHTTKDGLEENFYLDVQGTISHLKNVLNDKQRLTELLEKTIELRDNSNPEVTRFLRDSILFNSEIMDFVDQRIQEYFIQNN